MTLAFFGVGTPELLVFAVIVLLLFGNRLPQVMRSLGKSVTEFKKGVHEEEEVDDEQRRVEQNEE